jgi:hypothetical protein
MNITRRTRLTGLIVGAALSWATPVFAADAVSDWNEIAAAATAVGRPGAIGQTDMALTQVAMHDAWQAYDRRFEPYYAEIKPVAGGSRVAAAVAAVHGVLVGFYPAQAPTLDATYATYLANLGLTGDPGLAVGEAVAAKIVTLRRLDPNPLPLPDVGENVVGKWRPTQNHLGTPPLPPPAPFAFPWMGGFHPFVLTGPARFRAPPPPELTSDRYTTDFNEVKAMGALFGSTRAPYQTDIAYFWLDNFGVQLNGGIRNFAKLNLWRNGDKARLYALANLAAADALITAWDSKKHYNFWRPVTAIQEGEMDGNPNTAGEPKWLPFANTPPYPDYTSGAVSITAAMMRILSLYFVQSSPDSNYAPIRLTTANPLAINKTRTFYSFSAVSEEVVNVRVWQGIHFRFADQEARKAAEEVAEYVYAHALLPKQI